MNNSSLNKIKIDIDKSKGSYIFDQNTNRSFLDLMGMYSTLSVGYNNSEVFTDTDLHLLSSLFRNKITNCEINSNMLIDFTTTFNKYLAPNLDFTNSYFCPTGALAIEAALKTALRYKKNEKPEIISFYGSFHGVYGYGGLITDRFDTVQPRLENFPGNLWKKFKPFYNTLSNHLNDSSIENKLLIVENELKNNKNVSAILIEPIQCTFGDHYLDKIFLSKIRSLCDLYDIPLIFDEIQTGFYSSGKRWYSEKIEVIPDIIVFGKKLQVAGIIFSKKMNKVYEVPSTLEATWDADLIDMYRSKIIIEYLSTIDIESQIQKLSTNFINSLKLESKILNLRFSGYIIAFDLESRKARDLFIQKLRVNGLICNPTREKTVRLRPHLLFNQIDFDAAISIIHDSL